LIIPPFPPRFLEKLSLELTTLIQNTFVKRTEPSPKDPYNKFYCPVHLGAFLAKEALAPGVGEGLYAAGSIYQCFSTTGPRPGTVLLEFVVFSFLTNFHE